MRLTPELSAHLEDLSLGLPDSADLECQLLLVAELAVGAFPDCIAASVTVSLGGTTVTVSAVNRQLPMAGGGDPRSARPEGRGAGNPLSEEQWLAAARRSAAAGVGSSISVPLIIAGLACGSLDLYGRGAAAFDQLEELLPPQFAAGAVTANADLPFRAWVLSEDTGRTLADAAVRDQAAGVLIQEQGCSPAQAGVRMQDRAFAEGRSLDELARRLVAGAQRPV